MAVFNKIPLQLPRIATVLAVFVYAYLIVPSLVVIPISFSPVGDFTLDLADMSFGLYRELFGNPDWMRAITNSLVIALSSSFVATLSGVPAAYAFSRGSFRGKSVIQFVVISPLFVPVIVIALGLYFFGSSLGFQGDKTMLVLAHAMYGIPFVIVMMLSGLSSVDRSLERAAMIMGASSLRIFLQVVLPQLKVAIVASIIFSFLTSFDEVVIAWFLSGPSSVTLPVRMYSAIMWENTPVIAAISTLLTLVSFALGMLAVLLGANPAGLRAVSSKPA